MSKVRKQVADNLRRIRRKLNLSQLDLANLAGVSFEVISRTERMLTTPSLESLEKIAASLSMSIGDLIGDRPHSAETTRVVQLIDSLTQTKRRQFMENFEGLIEDYISERMDLECRTTGKATS